MQASKQAGGKAKRPGPLFQLPPQPPSPLRCQAPIQPPSSRQRQSWPGLVWPGLATPAATAPAAAAGCCLRPPWPLRRQAARIQTQVFLPPSRPSVPPRQAGRRRQAGVHTQRGRQAVRRSKQQRRGKKIQPGGARADAVTTKRERERSSKKEGARARVEGRAQAGRQALAGSSCVDRTAGRQQRGEQVRTREGRRKSAGAGESSGRKQAKGEARTEGRWLAWLAGSKARNKAGRQGRYEGPSEREGGLACTGRPAA